MRPDFEIWTFESFGFQPWSPIHIVNHPKSLGKNYKKEFQKRNSTEKERYKHETSTNHHLQKVTGGELFWVT